MYENGIDVAYELRGDTGWSEHRRVALPGWCAGDVPMALALHFFGHRDAVEDVRVTDWQPREAADDTRYDYERQAWVVDGRYVDCAHPSRDCGCYGRLHAGEPA